MNILLITTFVNGWFGSSATSLGRGGASAELRLPQIDLQYLLKHQFIHLVKQCSNLSVATTGFFMKPDELQCSQCRLTTKLEDILCLLHGISLLQSKIKLPLLVYPQHYAGTNAETLRGLEFNPDGTKVYYANTDYIYEYSLTPLGI